MGAPHGSTADSASLPQRPLDAPGVPTRVPGQPAGWQLPGGDTRVGQPMAGREVERPPVRQDEMDDLVGRWDRGRADCHHAAHDALARPIGGPDRHAGPQVLHRTLAVRCRDVRPPGEADRTRWRTRRIATIDSDRAGRVDRADHVPAGLPARPGREATVLPSLLRARWPEGWSRTRPVRASRAFGPGLARFLGGTLGERQTIDDAVDAWLPAASPDERDRITEAVSLGLPRSSHGAQAEMLDMQEAAGSSPAPPTTRSVRAQTDRITAARRPPIGPWAVLGDRISAGPIELRMASPSTRSNPDRWWPSGSRRSPPRSTGAELWELGPICLHDRVLGGMRRANEPVPSSLDDNHLAWLRGAPGAERPVRSAGGCCRRARALMRSILSMMIVADEASRDEQVFRRRGGPEPGPSDSR